MIEYIKGEIAELFPTQMVLECNGIGYLLNISLNTFTAFNGKQEGKIYVHEIIREDSYTLYGFQSKEERELFILLTSVSGVGPNTARMILSSFTPSDLVQVIADKNEDALTSVKGIGSKTSQRILVDLKNKIKNVGAATAANTSTGIYTGTSAIAEEAVAALVMLGFAKPASQKAVSSILKATPGSTVEQVIKQALRIL